MGKSSMSSAINIFISVRIAELSIHFGKYIKLFTWIDDEGGV